VLPKRIGMLVALLGLMALFAMAVPLRPVLAGFTPTPAPTQVAPTGTAAPTSTPAPPPAPAPTQVPAPLPPEKEPKDAPVPTPSVDLTATPVWLPTTGARSSAARLAGFSWAGLILVALVILFVYRVARRRTLAPQPMVVDREERHNDEL